MFTSDNLVKNSSKPYNTTPKKSNPHDHRASPIAYQNLNVIKKLSKAKFPVYLASSKINRQSYAMKLFAHKEQKPHPYYKNEIRFASLKHPNVIDIVYYENEKDTFCRGKIKRVSYILMEYAPFGDFFDFITNNGVSLDEKLIRSYFRQLIDGIEYLHANGVSHLDLKPENLLLGDKFILKIADFDLSHISGDPKILSKGTKFYRGPEFFRSNSDSSQLKSPFSADIYAAGIILFVLKSGGIYPHTEENSLYGDDLVDLLRNNNSEFWGKHCEMQDKHSSFYDNDFRDLFNGMVEYDPEERMSLKQIKESKWYNGPVYTPEELQKRMKSILKSLN